MIPVVAFEERAEVPADHLAWRAAQDRRPGLVGVANHAIQVDDHAQILPLFEEPPNDVEASGVVNGARSAPLAPVPS